MRQPLVSVVVPVYNGLPYLPIAVDSVLQQTYEAIELVLVDGGSNDGSREWIAEFETTRLKIVKDALPPGTTAAANWTRACELASGDYVKLLCQDDLLYAGALSLQVADLQAHPSARIAFARRDIIAANGRVLSRGRGCQGLPEGEVDGRQALLAGYTKGTNVYGEPVAVLFEREAMRSALPWEDSEPFLLDMFFYAKILARHSAVIRYDSVGAFRISAASWSTRLVSEQRRQFRSWQAAAALMIGGVTARQQALAWLNNEKTTQLRRAAYLWLRVRGRMGSGSGQQ